MQSNIWKQSDPSEAFITDPEGPEKYNNTEVKYGATFYSCHTALDTCCYEV
jgi:hypothetical protein